MDSVFRGWQRFARGAAFLLLLFCFGLPSIECVRLRNTRRPTPEETQAPSSLPTIPTSLRFRETDNTPAPTESPTESVSPTLETSLRVVQNRSSISYLDAYEEGVVVEFQYGSGLSPSDRDWIGMYHVVDDANGNDGWDPTQRLPSPTNQTEPAEFATLVAFLYGCNSPSPWVCAAAVLKGTPLPSEGTFSFGTETLGTSSPTNPKGAWPAEPGTYRFYLVRGGSPTNTKSNPPRQILATAQQTVTIQKNHFHHFILPDVRQAEEDIRALIAQEETLGPKFVRLGFHDCVGGCDGCVDMTLPDNAGLDIPIDALEPLVRAHENEIFSRADIWALAALVGADVAQTRSRTKVDFSLEFIGRENCESRGVPCLDSNGNLRPCHSKLGPHNPLPEADSTTEELFHFFSIEFGFSVQEVVALMGAHTIGSMSRFNSGFDAPNGWVRDNLLLDNDYYVELVGGFGREAPLEELIDFAPPWFRVHMDNADLPGIPSRNCWKARPPSLDGNGEEHIFMLNIDIALVRELNETNLLPGGMVTCTFTSPFTMETGDPRCPHAKRSLGFAADYRFDNDLWLRDFEKVYKKMLNHGYPYEAGKKCLGGICPYDAKFVEKLQFPILDEDLLPVSSPPETLVGNFPDIPAENDSPNPVDLFSSEILP